MAALGPVGALQILGGVLGFIGTMQQARASRQASEYNAAVARNNAIAARQQAQADAERHDRQTRLRLGANRARVGGAGITLAGSALDVFEDNAAQEELDRLNILHGGELRAIGFENDAGLSEMRARNTSGFFSASSAFLRNTSGTIGRAVSSGTAGTPLFVG